ncbi:MAG: dienelactone hydrolase family protein [Pseudonocardiaceae bacterium]
MARNRRQNVTFPGNGRQAYGYLKLPESGQGPGVVVIQEWWGLTDHILDVCDRFAAEGFVALAPDLFGGRTTHDAGEAARLMDELPVGRAARALSSAVDYLLGHEAVTSKRVGAVGFCMGGGFVLVLAAQAGEKVGAAVPFYAVLQGEPDVAGIKAPVLGHFAEADEFVPADTARALERRIRETGVDVTFHFYSGAGHAFFNDDNHLGTYHPGYAKWAWDRTVQFLRANL